MASASLADIKLHHINDEGGITIEEVPRNAKGQYTRDMLLTGDAYILDVTDTVFVWTGKGASKEEKKESMNIATKFIADNAAKTKGGFAGKGMTYDELVVHPDVEAIYCPLPTGLRNDWIRKAVAAGKHIYSEKPMGGTVAELKALLDACAAKGLQFMDGTMWYHSKRTRAIEALLASGELGPLKSVNAAFTFHFPDQAWLDGGNGRTDKSREPMGCLGDQGWYPLSAILWAFQWELPERVLATSTTLNKVGTIVACSGVLFFEGGRVATFDCGCTAAHRSQYEIVCELGTVRVDDLVGGQGRSGDFAAYELPSVGSGRYTKGDVMGKDEVVEVEECVQIMLITLRII